ncbi:MAG: fasciclin domain-containing protein [Verrucomicrobiota bacterium]
MNQNAILAGAVALLALSPSLFAEKKTIVETAVEAGSFQTLAAALTAAELVETLQGEGPFTVFAPTDEAFAKLPEGTVETLLKPENRKDLINVLTYHVIPGSIPGAIVTNLSEATALNEAPLTISVEGESLLINESTVVTADIACTNGVIHVIDAVLLPPADAPEQASMATPRSLIEMAIAKGVPLFNHGQHQACAALYAVTAHALLAMPADSVTAEDRKLLQSAMQTCNASHCSATNAWTMRHAFDAMLVANH